MFDRHSAQSHIAQAWTLSHDIHSDLLTTGVNADMGGGALTCVIELIVVENLMANFILGAD